MAELVPIPLESLLTRAFLEYRQEGKIFDLPAPKFFRGIPGLDFSVSFHGHRASTPLGPAAGPHGQLAQNIALGWLAGARIIELKTVQILDELKIPRPCIDVANVGYNVEWSQELKLEQSLREYVKAAMLIGILKAAKLPGEDFAYGDTVFDMSVGYNLDGIRSARVRHWIASMKDARAEIDKLRGGLAGPFARYRDLEFPARISDTVSLSTFHGCPADQIEDIVTFLLVEMGCHVGIKLNPTLLGQAEVKRLLHDVLGYREIGIAAEAFAGDLRFDEALDLIPRLQSVARARGLSLSVKVGNTLVVRNHKEFFADQAMYLSGAPLYVLALNLIRKLRASLRANVPISFSGGLDARNVAATLALNLVPVTACTDLLRPGGYGRLPRYLENLGARMTEIGVSNIAEYVAHFAGQQDKIVDDATADPRYSWERNRGVPRKIGSKLWLYDCINCDKCVPVCPNDANFVYEAPVEAIEYDSFILSAEGVRPAPGGVFKLAKTHQIANYADACNDCGNCDVFCPEDGGPQNRKPRFFGSLESYRLHAGANGFFVDWAGGAIHGTIGDESFTLTLDPVADRGWFDSAVARVEIRLSDHRALSWTPKPGAPATVTLDMLPYLKLKLLFESVGDPRHVNFVNVGRTPWSAAGPLAGHCHAAEDFDRTAGPEGPARIGGSALHDH
jgi:putative selenate reductase